MSAAHRSDPVRTCIGCRNRRRQHELVRVTRSPAGGVVVDGASAGRGAWLCRNEVGGGDAVAACLEAAIARRAFARAWRSEVTVDMEHQLRTQLGGTG